MKKRALVLILLAMASSLAAEELRVAVLDFENQAAVPTDAAVFGDVRPETIAEKGIYVKQSVAETDCAGTGTTEGQVIGQDQRRSGSGRTGRTADRHESARGFRVVQRRPRADRRQSWLPGRE